MNLINIFNKFMREDKKKFHLTQSQSALYLALVHICNDWKWQNPFEADNTTLLSESGIKSLDTLAKARRRLIDVGLIEYIPGGHGRGNTGIYVIGKGTDRVQKLEPRSREKVTDKVTDKVTENEPYTIYSIYNDTSIEKPNQTKRGSAPSAMRSALLPFDDIVEKWNEILGGRLPRVTMLSENRKARLRSRIAEWGGPDLAVAKAVEIFTHIASSDFLNGVNDRGWRADFDWIIKNTDNWVKVVEGRYDNRASNTVQSSQRREDALTHNLNLSKGIEEYFEAGRRPDGVQLQNGQPAPAAPSMVDEQFFE